MFFSRQTTAIKAKSEAVLWASLLVNTQAKALREMFHLITQRTHAIDVRLKELKALLEAEPSTKDAIHDEIHALVKELVSLDSSKDYLKIHVPYLVKNKQKLLSNSNAESITWMSIQDLFASPFDYCYAPLKNSSCLGPAFNDLKELQAAFLQMQAKAKKTTDKAMNLSLALIILKSVLVMILSIALLLAAVAALAMFHIAIPLLVVGIASTLYMMSVMVMDMAISKKQIAHAENVLNQPIDTSNLTQSFDELDQLVRELDGANTPDVEHDTTPALGMTA
jgi:hypothetical protein